MYGFPLSFFSFFFFCCYGKSMLIFCFCLGRYGVVLDAGSSVCRSLSFFPLRLNGQELNGFVT